MLSFKRAQTVAVGTVPTSEQYNSLALALNDRARSGLGDMTWRILFYFFGIFRQPRNSDGLFSFPSQGELLDFYAHINPKKVHAEWPAADPGEPEGANLANPLMAFDFGNPDLFDEQVRTDDVPIKPDGTMAEKWATGAAQRGVIDPVTGAQNVPAFTAAQSYFKATGRTPNVYVPGTNDAGQPTVQLSGATTPIYGKAYGGYVPIPEVVGDCGDETEDFPATPTYSIFFTPLRDGLPVKSYTGLCPQGSPGATGGVLIWIARFPFAYYLFKADGTIEVLDTRDYIEGPYTGGGVLQKTDGQQLTRALNAFIKDFRGSDDERAAEKYRVRKSGFDFQKFWQSQYFLSPNIGSVDPGPDGLPATDDDVIISAAYPEFTWTGSASFATGTLGNYSGGGTEHAYAAGFVLGGIYAHATKLSAPVKIDILDDQTVLGSITLKPDDTHKAEAMKWFQDAASPAPLRIRLATALQFQDGTGTFTVECTEQLEYKPQIPDAYLLLRLAATSGDVIASLDGSGVDYSGPKEISDNYFANGMILNVKGAPGLPPQGPDVNSNPVYDAVRRLSNLCLRVVNRKQFIGYELVDGKTVLYFKRYALGQDNTQVDPFDGIAPPADAIASGAIIEGEEYIVRATSGAVHYQDTDYSDGQHFTGLAGKKDYTVASGDAKPYVYEGIRRLPLKKGQTNEWLMFDQLKVYSPFDSNIFKPDSYADYFLLNNRCHFWSQQIRANPSLRDLQIHFNYGSNLSFAPEAPTGFNYAERTNTLVASSDEDRLSFYRSCRIYEPDEEIDSATVQIESGEEIVRLAFTTRFPHCDAAASIIARDWTTWDQPVLQAEPYRTRENALREYLVEQGTGGIGGSQSGATHECSRKIGDTGAESTFYGEWDGVFGSCWPYFIFTHLMPLKFEDGNDNPEKEHDSPAVMDDLMQAEVMLRSACEGYIDGNTSLAYACATGLANLFDYTFENACFDAFAGRWVSLMPEALRHDKPQGFGPHPATRFAYAEMFNQFTALVNKLNRVRVMLPFILECKTDDYAIVSAVNPNVWNPNITCSAGVGEKAIGTVSPPAPALVSSGDYDALQCVDGRGIYGFGASSSAGFTGNCIGDDREFASQKAVVSFRFTLTDALSINAVPEGWRDMLSSSQTGFIGLRQENINIPFMTQVGTQGESEGCGPPSDPPPTGFFWDSGLGHGWKFDLHSTNTLTCDLFFQGSIDPGTAPGGDFYIGHPPSGGTCANGSSHSIAITPVGDNPTMFIEVPLVD